MKFTEMGKQDGKTMLLLPGTACTWEINFHTVIDRLAEQYHLICVNYIPYFARKTLVKVPPKVARNAPVNVQRLFETFATIKYTDIV